MSISVPSEQCIMNLRKADMQDIAEMFGETLPSSWKKEQMSQRLAEIYEQSVHAILPMLSLMVVSFLRMIFEKGLNGKLHASDYNFDAKCAPLDQLYDQLEYLGLIDYTGVKISVADILKNVVTNDQTDEQLAEWQQMEMCAEGIIMAYGILEERVFHRMFNDCYPDMNREETSAFLNHRLELLTQCGRICINGETWWFSGLIDDPEDWYIMMNTRKDIPYRKYTRNEYIEISITGLTRKPKNFDKLVTILIKNGMSQDEAEATLYSAAIDHCCQLDIRSGIPDFIKEHTWDSMREAERIIGLYNEFANDTPIWYNKGHSPNEIFNLLPPHKGKPQFVGPFAEEMSTAYDKIIHKQDNVIPFPSAVITSKKVGRNAPCPCGSGKKYKNCCGRVNKNE